MPKGITSSKRRATTNKRVAPRRWLFIGIGVFLILVFVGIGALMVFQRNHAGRIYTGVKINGYDLGGLNREQAFAKLRQVETDLQENGMIFFYADTQVSVQPIVVSANDPDLAKPIVNYDWTRTLDLAEGYGRRANPVTRLFQQLRAAVQGVDLQAYYELDERELRAILEDKFVELERPPVSAQIKIVDGEVEVVPEISGFVFSYDAAIDTLKQQIGSLSFEPIELALDPMEPHIKQSQVGSALNSIPKILAIPELTLVYENDSWAMGQDKIIDWLEFQLTDDGDVVVGLKRDPVIEFLTPIAQEINIEAEDAKFEISSSGRVVEFKTSNDGLELGLEENYELLNGTILLGGPIPVDDQPENTVELAVAIQPSKVAVGELNDLGIKELLGEGRSNFAGSPRNRRLNIATGIASINGVLIAPGEEYSQLEALGEIDAANGYLQELVIKGDRTVPEYGGGLCQLCTTTFRTVLNSGLPITARRNHSFKVRYYEPAGTDATIYDPAPDFRFINDTGYHILFLARVVGDELVYQFWGTDDGREVTFDPWPPRVYNLVSPGEPRFIETDELPPGKKKKVESAVPGADAYFKYTVNYPDGEVFEKEFYSHYIPWREVWLVGRDPNATSTDVDLDEVESKEN